MTGRSQAGETQTYAHWAYRTRIRGRGVLSFGGFCSGFVAICLVQTRFDNTTRVVSRHAKNAVTLGVWHQGLQARFETLLSACSVPRSLLVLYNESMLLLAGICLFYI